MKRVIKASSQTEEFSLDDVANRAYEKLEQQFGKDVHKLTPEEMNSKGVTKAWCKLLAETADEMSKED